MVHVLRVRMRVGALFVLMHVRVFTFGHRIVHVVVMPIVVVVRVIVREGRVRVPVLVMLGCVKPHPKAHERGRAEEHGRRGLSHRERDERAHERRRREHRRGARSAQTPLRKQVETQAEPKTQGATRENADRRPQARHGVGKSEREGARERTTERGFRQHDGAGVALGQRTRQRIVERPSHGRQQNRREPEDLGTTGPSAVHDEERAAQRNQRCGQDHATTKMLGIHELPERDGKASLEVEHQRGAGTTRSPKPPRERHGGDEGPTHRDGDQTRCVRPT